MKELPSGVARLFGQLTEHLPKILGDCLFGTYSYGSITQDAFDATRSDVDCVVLVHSGLTEAQVEALNQWLTSAAVMDPWVTRLQMSILVKDELFMVDGQGWLYQFGALKRSGSDGNPLIWLNILASGMVLWGPPPRSFLPSITTEMVVQALDRELGYLREEIIDNASQKWRDVPFYRAYAVLTICRILYTRSTGRIGSKPEAAAWALENVPEAWHTIINEALAFDRGERGGSIALRRIAGFIGFAERRLAAA